MKPVGRKQDYPLITEDEMEVFSLLERNGLPFQDAINLSFKQYDAITALLQKGIPFFEIVRHQKGRRLQRMASLMEYFSLSQAVQYDQKLQKTRDLLTKKLLSNSLYPLFIMAFASILIWFFSENILPAFSAFESEDTALLDSLKILSGLFWFVVIIIGALIAYFLYTKPNYSIGWSLLFKIPLLKILCSCECAALLECNQNSGLATVQMISFMQKAAGFPFASIVSRHWQKKLSQGDSLLNCIAKDDRLDDTFVRFFEIGSQVSMMEAMMKSYQESSLIKLERITKKISNYILYFAYGSVGLLAISVYQIMLAPLNLLESF